MHVLAEASERRAREERLSRLLEKSPSNPDIDVGVEMQEVEDAVLPNQSSPQNKSPRN
jgi:hypothetical protein